MAEQTSGTISPAEPFDKDADTKALFEATQGLGTKEKVITEILTKRTNSQRQDIIEAYVLAYDEELLDVMKSELSGNFLSVVEGILDEPAVHLAKAVHKYATNTSMLPTDLGLRLLEIIFPLNYLETSYIKEVYQQVFGSILDEDITLNVFGPWKLILINVEMGQRHETACIDSYKVDQDVQYLEETPIDDWALPNARIEDLLIRDSVQHLQKVFKRVKQSMSEKGVDIIQAIKDSNMTTEQKDGFVAVVSICTDYVRFNATILHKAMSGVGTNDDTLIRVIVSRCEIDLENIKSEFQQMYGVSLRDWISSDTSGNYRDILLAIIGD
ncbi:annexin A13-like isoform X2 [Strongylocentrotus purpuratus]|uniref:Annexin n=1 Tax=Strongylocentrotus purpuratus TaxID=7668 RepID=A0A7M7SXL0_STRPU|nr:annexin A13-like isoform X2 [Strongylocentrotus purpuratus]